MQRKFGTLVPGSISFVLLASVASFITYSCMYGFRKPYTASSYAGYSLFGISYKSVLVIAQVLGYMAGKFYGIRFIATIRPRQRAGAILVIIAVAWSALLLFALIPPPYNFVCMFLNGFPLAMVWGLVFSYLEGRKVTEITGAILATSIIFASGLAKTVGKWLMLHWQVSEWWMPFAAGLIFIIPLLVCVALLNTLPPPGEEDIRHRTLRKTMDKKDRKLFLKRFGIALIPVVLAYGMLTILRDFCEDFANELWKEVGLGGYSNIFVDVSTLVAVIVLVVVLFFFFIKNNYTAFKLNHVAILAGFLIAIGATLLFSYGKISPILWMVAATSGLYLGYMPYNCFYFERLLATYRVQGNVGFVMYIADAFGYLGTVLVLIIKEFTHLQYSWVSLFKFLFYAIAITGIVLISIGWLLFKNIYIIQEKNNA
ncbi:MAG: hypothetical protein J7539_03730 [Niabella sp.]|nr:hypothetical protein [Niabella sp.]